MENTRNLKENRLADAWAELQKHSDEGFALEPDAYRLAFADPEFLLRRETRGIRFQLEMLKPELEQEQQQIDHTVVVYGSARVRPEEEVHALIAQAHADGDHATLAQETGLRRGAGWYQAARLFGHTVATLNKGKPRDQHMYICTGGGPGIMEAANRGASEAGEPTVGLNITLPHEQHANPYITPGLSFKFHYFALRKMHFMIRAKALVVFPGGFGTLDELFEVITLVQTRKAKPVPIILYDKAYWQRLLHLDVLVEEGMIAAQDLDLLHFAETPLAAWEHIAQFYKLG